MTNHLFFISLTSTTTVVLGADIIVITQSALAVKSTGLLVAMQQLHSSNRPLLASQGIH